jgi:hypothetical protein
VQEAYGTSKNGSLLRIFARWQSKMWWLVAGKKKFKS